MNGEKWLSAKAAALQQGAIRAMFDKARTMKNVISMGIGEPDLPTPAPICDACTEALAKDASDIIEKYSRVITPAIILIPGVSGNTGEGMSSVMKSIERAVGSAILD